MLAVRCRGHGGVVEPHVLAGRQARAVGQDDVVLGEAFFDGGRRGNDDHELGSESEENIGPYFCERLCRYR